ncbi:MAG TPA: TDP-N-acetylfucosamine:lipid II N-acetylfucosaminyltransferase [Burkholderiales bacterium]|nr:TDP-N-acetylfucosamine:lipid II N-acetylfucosaminyltransferase [Burkholderiales bacterium]
MNILHLIHDNKFFSFVTEVFGARPGVQNRYVAHVPDPAAALQHIGGVKLWRRVGNRYFFSRQVREDLEWSDCLIVHYAYAPGALMMLRAPARVTVVWSGWGADYLDLTAAGGQAMHTGETARLLADIRRKRLGRGLREAGRCLLEAAWLRFVDRPLRVAAIARADLFSAPLREDFDLLRAALGSRLRAQYAQLHYASVERTFRPGPEALVGGDILLGNSATPTNNHAEMLHLLARRDLGDRKVIVPLSYGDAYYRDAIAALGRRLLGDHFEPVLDFVPLSDYNTLIARCSTVIMNHRRQQAIGNIGAMLYRGARVFLDDSGAVYRFLRAQGAHVFSTSLLKETGDAVFDLLKPEQRMQNRAVLDVLWSHDTVMKNTAGFVEAAGQCLRARA